MRKPLNKHINVTKLRTMTIFYLSQVVFFKIMTRIPSLLLAFALLPKFWVMFVETVG